jgi:hypothetical protein
MPSAPDDLDAGASHPQSYTDNGDGTVTDNVTGLTWQKDVSLSDGGSWAGAAAFCSGLQLGGHGGWRLPSVIELISLVDRSSWDGGSTPADFFWASELVAANGTSLGWIVNFAGGGTNGEAVANVHNLRCVR